MSSQDNLHILKAMKLLAQSLNYSSSYKNDLYEEIDFMINSEENR